MAPKTNARPVPLGCTPVIDTPFKFLSADIVRPITTPSKSGNRYILSAVDHVTRYPEAVVLKKVDAVTIAVTLLGIWSRVGIPDEVLTDQGPQLISEITKEFDRLLSVKHHKSSIYHPISNGLTERFNGTLMKLFVLGNPRTETGICQHCCLPTRKSHKLVEDSHRLKYFTDVRSKDIRE